MTPYPASPPRTYHGVPSGDAISPIPSPCPSTTGYRELLRSALAGDPGAVLVSDSVRRVTRGELAERVGAIGSQLVAIGAGPEVLVALRFDPGVDSIVAILSVLSTGAAYLPLDPRHGDARIDQILAATTPDILLDAHGPQRLADPVPQLASRGLSDLAYVISTSGSTGQPKAAELEQRGLLIHTKAMIELLELGVDDVVLQSAPPSFDIAVWQCSTPPVAGSRVHVANAEQRLSPKALWDVLIDERVTVTQLVPSMIRMLLDDPPPRGELALRHVISTGEALDPALANRWFDRFPDLALINLYGPAECSDDVSVHTLNGHVEPDEVVPIGRPFAGAILRIVDNDGHEAATGDTGTLQVCGDLVGRGYRNDPVRTAEVFSTTSISGNVVRSYDTGDLVYADNDGLLRYVGRSDFQVKVRGNRVELGEIEAVIVSHPDVDVCVVTKFTDDTDRLCAHVQTPQAIPRQALKQLAAAALPTYMVPSAFVLYDRLPLNANGKIDRRQLDQPTSTDLPSSELSGSIAEPATDIEQAIARNWAKLLGLAQVPVDADFFDLGGTSLLAVVSIDDLHRELGHEIPTQTFITAGTIQQIAATISPHSALTVTGVLPAIDDSSSEPGEPAAIDPAETGLVQIQDHPDGVPLFLYPGEAVSALGMVELARMIDPDRSVYVFEPSRPVNGQPGPTMAVLAERCRRAIATVHSDGPVHLAGFCMGGDVAWEIASQRAAQNQPTASVILLQTERDGNYPEFPDHLAQTRIRAALGWQRVRFEAATIRALARAQRRSHIRHLIIGKAVAKFTLPVEKWLHQSRLGSRFGSKPSLRLRQHLWALIDRAAYSNWTPRRLDCPVAVIAATEQPPYADPDPTLGWASTGTRSISTRQIPGFHWSFLHRPAVIGVAAAISDELRKVEAG